MPVFFRQTFPLLLTFLVISIMAYLLDPFWESRGIDARVLRLGNTVLFLISLLSFYIQLRSLHHPNPHAFVRGVMVSLLMKMVLVVLFVLLYYSLSGPAFNTKSVVACLIIYLVYLGVEGTMLSRINKRKHA